MEPGHEDREYIDDDGNLGMIRSPQWSPVMKTGNTSKRACSHRPPLHASMEPGHEDREYPDGVDVIFNTNKPQWSPVMKTGNTSMVRVGAVSFGQPQWSPVMKTGNTRICPPHPPDDTPASMEPGHEDREYIWQGSSRRTTSPCLNGARS